MPAFIPKSDELSQIDRDLRFHPSTVTDPRTLTRQQVAAFNRDGYLKGVRIFDSQEITAIRAYFDKLLALSVLPILFIAFGIDELSKIMLIVIGVTPTIILDTVNLTRSVPREQIVKGFTLGAHDFGVTYGIVLRQIMPRVLNSIRLNLRSEE